MQANWVKLFIEEKLETYLVERDMFLVDIEIHLNTISVMVDTMDNVTISQLAETSRFLEPFLDESPNISPNYNLEVSSPGMSNSLKKPFQYKKRLQKDLQIWDKEGKDFFGKITYVDDQKFTLSWTIPANKKTKTPEEFRSQDFLYDQISKALIPIKF
ncbi:MAG: hypothetical protein MUE53_05840 [Chitinophagales bacterium]|jgi:ribosome maturation factor RimP|nr:hypothetical protein [Chitinophagales bacterium]